jgi:hypothetical protein
MFYEVIHDGLDLDCVQAPNVSFANSNMLHYMALNGVVRCMEQAVAHGAAIDYPFLNEEQCGGEAAVVAPTDTTALVLLCATLALY